MLSTQSLAQSQVTLLKKTDPAPYAGALLPIEDLKALQKDHLNAIDYKKELEEHESEMPLFFAPDSKTFVIIGMSGVVLGFVLWALVH